MPVGEPRVRLHIAGRILHICKKKSDAEKKPGSFEMRWAAPEDFLEIKVMPRMMLDHFPPSVGKPLTKILKENIPNTKEEDI
jgi:sn1-specific diacylglycerol lipase